MKKQWIAMLLVCSMIAGGVQSIGASEESYTENANAEEYTLESSDMADLSNVVLQEDLQEVFFEEEEEDLELGVDAPEVMDSVPESAVYYVVLPETLGGSLSFIDRGNLPAAEENADEAIKEIRGFHAGDEIETQVIPDKGYFLESLHITSREDIAREYEFIQTESGCVFVMPEETVTVNAVFAAIKVDTPQDVEEQSEEQISKEPNEAEQNEAEQNEEKQKSDVQEIETVITETQDIPAEEQEQNPEMAGVLPDEATDEPGTADEQQSENIQMSEVQDGSEEFEQQSPSVKNEIQETDVASVEEQAIYGQEADAKESSQAGTHGTEAEEEEEAQEAEVDLSLQYEGGATKEDAVTISFPYYTIDSIGDNENDQHWYKFELNDSGRVSIDAEAAMEWIYYFIYDTYGNLIWSANPHWDSTYEYSHIVKEVDLTKGIYYFVSKKDTYGTNTGPFMCFLDFTSAEETIWDSYMYPNNNTGSTDYINLGSTYHEQIAENDSIDYYKFYMDDSGRLAVKATAEMGWIYYRIYDENNNQVFTVNPFWDEDKGKSDISERIALSPGYYYFVAERDSGYTGNYSFTLTAEVPVTGVKLNKTSRTIAVGKTAALTATVSPSNASNKNVTWKSSNTSVATVNSKGVVTGKKAGTATITVTTKDGNKTATCKVTVKVPVSGVKLNKTRQTIAVGKTAALTATVSPSNASNKNVTWKSSNTSVATVSSKGVVTGKKAGTATITVTTKDGSKTATCKITVKMPVTGVKLNKKSQTIAVGKTAALKATVSPSNAISKEVTWKSSNTSVATVNSKGVVTGKKAGTATITVTTKSGGKKATFKVTVRVPVTGIKLNKNTVVLANGESVTLKATVSPANASNKKVRWYSSNPDLATVNSRGKVTAKPNADGIVYILGETVDGEFWDECEIDIRKPIVSYRTHVQTYGWQSWKKNGAMSGTQGQSKRLEGINIKLSNLPYSGGITYRTHVQTYGWQGWRSNGAMSGTSGQAKRLEAIQIKLTGEMAKHYDVYYRVHAQHFGWMGWAKNGEKSGTAGYAYRLEGIQIILVKKGGSKPSTSLGGQSQWTSVKFKQKSRSSQNTGNNANGQSTVAYNSPYGIWDDFIRNSRYRKDVSSNDFASPTQYLIKDITGDSTPELLLRVKDSYGFGTGWAYMMISGTPKLIAKDYGWHAYGYSPSYRALIYQDVRGNYYEQEFRSFDANGKPIRSIKIGHEYPDTWYYNDGSGRRLISSGEAERYIQSDVLTWTDWSSL